MLHYKKTAPARAALKSTHNTHSNSPHKSQLLSPAAVLDMLGVRYHRTGAVISGYCPFHKEGKERNPSLIMDAKDGHYKCFACGEKGGDVIAFYRAVTGKCFKSAIRALSAWRAGI
jgi:DNA primase